MGISIKTIVGVRFRLSYMKASHFWRCTSRVGEQSPFIRLDRFPPDELIGCVRLDAVL